MVFPVSIKEPRGLQYPPSRNNSDVVGSYNHLGAHFLEQALKFQFKSNISCQQKKYPSLGLRPGTRESLYTFLRWSRITSPSQQN
jgi:hypothetical protein